MNAHMPLRKTLRRANVTVMMVVPTQKKVVALVSRTSLVRTCTSRKRAAASWKTDSGVS